MPRVFNDLVPIDRDHALPAQGHDDDLLREAARRNSGSGSAPPVFHRRLGKKLKFDFVHHHDVRQWPKIVCAGYRWRGVEHVQGLGSPTPREERGDRRHRNLQLADQHIAGANGHLGNRGGIERPVSARNHDDGVFAHLIDENHGRAGRRLGQLERAGDAVFHEVRPQVLPEGVFAHAAHQGRSRAQPGRRHRLVGAFAPRVQGKTLAGQCFAGLRQPGHRGHQVYVRRASDKDIIDWVQRRPTPVDQPDRAESASRIGWRAPVCQRCTPCAR